jgi:hypothetical protein
VAAPDTALFVPDVPRTYDGTIVDPGLEIIAHSIGEGSLGHQWIVVLQNVSSDIRLCTATMRTTFFDAAGTEIARSNLGAVYSPLKRGCSGTCGFMSCMNPGETGVVFDETSINDLDVSLIASFTFAFGGLNVVDAEPTDDATISGLQVVADDPGSRYRGLLVNNTNAPFESGSVRVFGLTAAGRPLFGVWDTGSGTIGAFDSWQFETNRFPFTADEIGDVIAFPEVREP